MADAQHPYGPPNILTDAQVYQLASTVGLFSTRPGSASTNTQRSDLSAAEMATAIALAESGGDASIVNVRSGATGLWQIYPGGAQYISPNVNAVTAHAKYVAQSWGAWSTYTSGAYQGFVARAQAARGQRGAPTPGSYGQGQVPASGFGIPNPLHGIEAIGAFFAALMKGSTWLRVLFVLGGIGLLAFALFRLADETKVGHSAIQKAKLAAVA